MSPSFLIADGEVYWSHVCFRCDITWCVPWSSIPTVDDYDFTSEVQSSSPSSPFRCPRCNHTSSDLGNSEDEEESQSSDSVEPILTVEISPSMLRCSSSDEATLQCTICLEDFVAGESAQRLPCSHFFHSDCIIPWLTSQNTCPICRFVVPSDETSGDEDDTGLSQSFDALALEDDLEEDA